MKKFFPILILLLLISCSQKPAVDMGALFEKHDVYGCFVLQDLKTGERWEHNAARLDSAFLPASTFKIPNSIFALEYSAVADTSEIIPWDGVERWLPAWNKDHNLNSAIKVSCVPFYQKIARRIGEANMQEAVNKANYGNKNISGGIDVFWLEGGIRISANEQIEFLDKFYNEKLPFAKENVRKVKDILLLEQGEDYKFYAKTGTTAREVDHPIGWYVGFVEHADEVFLFATNIDRLEGTNMQSRIDITKEILREFGVL